MFRPEGFAEAIDLQLLLGKCPERLLSLRAVLESLHGVEDCVLSRRCLFRPEGFAEAIDLGWFVHAGGSDRSTYRYTSIKGLCPEPVPRDLNLCLDRTKKTVFPIGLGCPLFLAWGLTAVVKQTNYFTTDWL